MTRPDDAAIRRMVLAEDAVEAVVALDGELLPPDLFAVLEVGARLLAGFRQAAQDEATAAETPTTLAEVVRLPATRAQDDATLFVVGYRASRPPVRPAARPAGAPLPGSIGEHLDQARAAMCGLGYVTYRGTVYCTRPASHDGDHEAAGLGTWPR